MNAAHRVLGPPMARPLIESCARATPRRARRRARRSQQTTAVVSLGAASRRPSSGGCGGMAEVEHTAQTTMSACGNMVWALSQDIVVRALDRAELSKPVSGITGFEIATIGTSAGAPKPAAPPRATIAPSRPLSRRAPRARATPGGMLCRGRQLQVPTAL